MTGLVQWIAVYTWLEPWWKRGNQIGHSLVLLALLAMATPVLFILALFFDISRFTSQTLAWIEVGVFTVTFLAMGWRSVIWVKTARSGRAGTLPAGRPPQKT